MTHTVSLDAAKKTAATALSRVHASTSPTGEDFFDAALALTRLEELSGLKLDAFFAKLAAMKYGRPPLETPAA